MPGWILVANRFSLLPIISSGVFLRVIASLSCLVVVSGCSNIRQPSLEMPLPILPSEVARATQTTDGKIDLPSLAVSDAAERVSADGGPIENASALEQGSNTNDFVASKVEQSPSAQSFMPSENDFQLQQPHARFVGELKNAEMKEIDATANAKETSPAPTIVQASHTREIEACETPEVCNATAQCDCCKKKEPPTLTVVEPFDPEQLPGFAPNKTTPENRIAARSQTTLQPLKVTNAGSTPITLTAKQNWQTRESQNDSKNGNSAQTQNKAQMLIPIAPAALQELKAEVDQIAKQEAQAAAAKQSIKVDPNMNIESAPANDSFAGPASAAVEDEATAAFALTKLADQSKLSPNPSTGIRVSEVPFQSLPVPLPKPGIPIAEPVAEPAPAFVLPLTPLAGPMPMLTPIEIAKVPENVNPLNDVKALDDVKALEIVEDAIEAPVPSNDFSPLLISPAMPIQGPVVEQAVADQVDENQEANQQAVEPAEQVLQVIPQTSEASDNDFNQFVAPSSTDIDPMDDADPMDDIDPMVDLYGLREMSQIDEEIAELKRSKTFDPSTVIPADRIDPRVLRRMFDGPPKTMVAPAAKVVQANPNDELFKQQLLEIQESIKELKVKPATPAPAALELTLRNSAFCTKISGFGQFRPFAANNFSSSQKTLLYCEVENQTAKQFTNFDGSQQFETVLHGSLVIYDANDQIVQTANFPAIKDVARHQRRDFYVYFPVQFDNLERGDYRLELSLEDASADKSAVLRPFMRFSVR